MREFFAGWRKKIGALTLLTACLLMAGWVRSLIVDDIVIIPCGQFVTITTISNDHVFGVQYHRRIEPQNRSSIPSWRRFIDSTKIKRLIADPYITWHQSFCGFRLGETVSSRPGRLVLCLIPYWFIVIPMTMLSAFLLLTRPCLSSLKKITEPVVRSEDE
jgi:hypothetical protein